MNKKHLIWIIPFSLVILFIICFLSFGYYLIKDNQDCTKMLKPFCLPLPDNDLNDIATGTLEDMNVMMPDKEFKVWVKAGCILSCEVD